MRFLLFIISFLYSFIFYVFYKLVKTTPGIINLSFSDSIIFSSHDQLVIQSLFGNLLIESIIFFIIGIILFVYFSSTKSVIFKNEVDLGKNIREFFTISNLFILLKKFSYYFGFLFFYISLYLMSLGFEFVSFSLYILFLNIVILIYFFASRYSKLSSDFLKINSTLFSLTYIFSYFYIIFTNTNSFGYIDFVNSFFIIISFCSFLYFDKIKNEKKGFDEMTLFNLIVYIFSVFLFYFYHYLLQENLTYWLAVLSTVFGILLFEFIPKIRILANNKITFRYIGIIFDYIGIFYGIMFLLFSGFSLVIYLILIIQIAYNIFIHKKYLNLISFFISLFLIIFLIYYLIFYFSLIDYKGLYFLIFGILFSFIMIGTTYYLKIKSPFDNYIIHSFSYFVNIVSVVMFLAFNYTTIAIFYIGLLFFIESIYFFLSYTKISSKKLQH